MNAPLPPDAVAVALLRVTDISASRSNPRKRFDDAYIAELADSIKSHGLIQPITVRPIPLDSIFAFNKARKAGDESQPPTYEIVVGECRWRAAKLAGLTEIPAFWRELDDKQVLEIQVIENLRRRTYLDALHRTATMPAEDLFHTANSYFGLLRQTTHSHVDRARLANLLRDRGHTINGDLTKTYRKSI